MKNNLGLTAILLATLSGGAQGADCTAEDPGKAKQVGQKIDLLERLLGDSEPMRRAVQSGDSETLLSISTAKQTLDEAKQALADGCVAEASALSSDGLKLASTAFRKAPKRDVRVRETYEQALQQATSFMLSLESYPEEVRGLGPEDLVGIERQIERAESVAANGDFTQAGQLLVPVNDRLQRRLTSILDNKTIYYEKSFATPADEYAYLKEQYEGYMLLLQSGQKTVAYSAKTRVDEQLNSAMTRYAAAEQSAATEAWDEAIASMLEAVSACEVAVRTTGYSY
jgi:hypothetical protein